MSSMARTAAERLSDTRATTADGLETAASALHKGAAVETLVKNNPGSSLFIAAAFGFLLGRAVARH
jgi:ElaB/YqjD/DUF883 family membrane-anchored ribosome-binding protein